MTDTTGTVERLTIQRDDARFIADKKHEMIEKMRVGRDSLIARVAALETENRRLKLPLAQLLRNGIGVAGRKDTL